MTLKKVNISEIIFTIWCAFKRPSICTIDRSNWTTLKKWPFSQTKVMGQGHTPYKLFFYMVEWYVKFIGNIPGNSNMQWQFSIIAFFEVKKVKRSKNNLIWHHFYLSLITFDLDCDLEKELVWIVGINSQERSSKGTFWCK